MSTTWRLLFAAAACAVAIALAPAAPRAEETAGAPPAARAAPGEKPQDGHAAAGCPYSEGAACCGTCQDRLRQGEPAEDAAADCPCKRARKAAKPQGS
jgi:hypothetical protein